MNTATEQWLDRVRRQRKDRPRGRYAPSPTGLLHLGNLRTALLAWLQARSMDGVFVMRMEDLDRPRNKAGCAEKILDDLRRLGLDWDEGPDCGGPFVPYGQAARADIHQAFLELLKDRGRLYPCHCSRRDIREAASAPHGANPVYPGTCREPGAAARGQDSTTAWRFAVADEIVSFHDCVQGMCRQRLATEVGDFVVRRRDGLFAYQFAVVVDDALMGVTDVVRGEDLLDSTPRQIALQAALGLATPRYWHVPLMLDDQGQRMSKRNDAPSLDDYCAAGGTPESLIGRFAADLGLADSDAPLSARELLSGLDRAALTAISG